MFQNYQVLKKLGEGSFGKVYEAECRNTAQIVAIKHIHDFAKTDYALVSVIRELTITRQIGQMSSEFIPGLIDVIIPKKEKSVEGLKNIFLIMEYEGKDLTKLLDSSNSTNITQNHVRQILYNLLCAIKFIHSTNVLHRDLKPANILIDPGCGIKICDFGISRT